MTHAPNRLGSFVSMAWEENPLVQTSAQRSSTPSFHRLQLVERRGLSQRRDAVPMPRDVREEEPRHGQAAVRSAWALVREDPGTGWGESRQARKFVANGEGKTTSDPVDGMN